MWLRNFYNRLASLLIAGGAYTSTSVFDDSNLSEKQTSGSFCSKMCGNDSTYTYNFYPYWSSKICTLTNNNYSNGGLIFGSGDTPVSFDDYKLDSHLTFTKNVVNYAFDTPTYDETTRTWSSTWSGDIKNTSSNDIEIKEIGITAYPSTLLYREVLEEPFILQAGQTMNYKHTFKFTMPEHS